MGSYQEKILIIDSNQDSLKGMVDCLFMGNYLNVHCATDGLKAIKIAKKEIPELIIIDSEINGIDYREILKSFKKETKTKFIPVIVVSQNHNHPQLIADVLKDGSMYFISRPFQNIEFLGRVRSAIDLLSGIRAIYMRNQAIENEILILKENERRLLALQNASDEARVFVENDIIIEANMLFCEFTGYSREEVLDHSFLSFFPGKDRKNLANIASTKKFILVVSLKSKVGEAIKTIMILKKINYENKDVMVASFLKMEQFCFMFRETEKLSINGKKTLIEDLKNKIGVLEEGNANLLNQLQFKTLQMANNNSLILDVCEILAELLNILPESRTKCRAIVFQALAQMKTKLNNGFWDEFKLRFSELHTGFYDKLLKQFPTLTETDLRLCAFIKLKMSTKEIAHIISQPVNSVKVSRSRLRKKLLIKDIHMPLLNFFANF